jgi:hypothetical protein
LFFKINKKFIPEVTQEFGACYEWFGEDVPQGQRVFHLVAYSD